MLILPASNVSVPLTVVMRSWVKTSESDLDPEVTYTLVTSFLPISPDATHVLVEELKSERVIAPCTVTNAAHCPVLTPIPKPAVKAAPTGVVPLFIIKLAER